MAKKWREVEQSEGFKKLSSQEQSEAKQEYFDSVVAPQVPGEDRALALNEFMGSVKQPTSQKQERPSILSQLVRTLMRGSPIEQLKTSRYALENVNQMPTPQEGQSLEDYSKSYQTALQPREEEIARKGTLPQLEEPMMGALAVTGAQAPAQLLKGLLKFGALETGAEIVGINKAIQGIQQPELRDITDIAKFGIEGVLASQRWIPYKSEAKLNFELQTIAEKELARIGIKPTPTEAKQYGNVKNFYNKATNALKSIHEAKDTLSYTYPDGTKTSGLPKNLHEFAQAIPQVKKMIYEAYNSGTQKASGQGITIDTRKTSEVILNEALKTEKEILNPEIQNYALKLAERLEKQGKVDVKVAEKIIEEVNTTLNNYFKHPSEELRTKSFIEAIMAKDIRQQLDINIQQATGVEYQALKNKYGALSSIEKYVNRIMLRTKEKPADFTDFIGTFGTADILKGVASGNVGEVISGLTIKGSLRYFKNLSEPNKRIEALFRNLDKIEGEKAINRKVIDLKNSNVMLTLLLKLKQQNNKTNKNTK